MTDKYNMRRVILDFPKQFKTGLDIAGNITVKGKFNNVIICGMGGSALAGELVRLYLLKINKNVPIAIHRDYGLPKATDRKSLLVCVSYSGNTEETISSFKEALKNNNKIVGITTGGILSKLCKKNNVPLITIPSTGIQPRSSVGYQFFALIKLLANSRVIKIQSKEILQTAKNLKPEKLLNKIPLIYTSNNWAYLAYNWKIKFNENSKILAFANYFPELNHNELVGFSQNILTKEREKCPFHVIMLRDEKDNKRNLKRMAIMKEILRKKNVSVDIIDISGYNLLTAIFSNLLLGDWTSYYLALYQNIDPTPVAIIEEFKKKLKT